MKKCKSLNHKPCECIADVFYRHRQRTVLIDLWPDIVGRPRNIQQWILVFYPS